VLTDALEDSMKTLVIGMAVVAAAFAASMTALRAQAPTRTVWDGIYGADQAMDGKTLFDAKCASCHGADLAGTDQTPPLTGHIFMTNWSTMPQNDPGSLNNKQVADVVSYILSVNQFPAGTTLPNDPTLQNQINIVSEKPAAK
jgi:mono/diheme cytochrome c family protein